MNTNWQDKIIEANKAGDYKLAAQYEQARNDKINSANYTGKQTTTNNYAGWLDDTDYSAIGQQQIASGASWQDVLDTYNNRLNKSTGTVGMEKFINDEHSQAMLDYIYAGMENAAATPTYSYDASKPTYANQNQSRIDAMLNQILNRDAFSYNAESDPLYQQYAAMYQREGNRAMNDTLAAAASTAGGMNSYAVTAAQQANNYYSSQLNDKIPELYQLAYEMYLQDIDNQVRDLGLLQQMDETQYGRYRDTMSDWQNDRNFAYNQYRDDMGDYQWNKNFDYNAGRDNVMDERYDNEWNHMLDRESIEDGRYRDEWWRDEDRYKDGLSRGDSDTAYNRAMEILASGAMPDDEMLKQAGMTPDQASSILAIVQAQIDASLDKGGNGYTGDNGDKPAADKGDSDDPGYEGDKVKTEPVDGDPELSNAIINLGIGPVNEDTVRQIMDLGGIVEKNGGFVWTNGWSQFNWQDKLKGNKGIGLYAGINF